MKGLKAVAKKSQNIKQADRATWIDVYYNFTTDTVTTNQTAGSCFVTHLINPNTEADIKEVIERWKRM